MHTAEEVRFLATVYTGEDHGAMVREALLAYANLLESMEEVEQEMRSQGIVILTSMIRQRAAEKQKARKG